MSKGPGVGSRLAYSRNFEESCVAGAERGSERRHSQGGTVEPDCRASKPVPLISRVLSAQHLTQLVLAGSHKPCRSLY